MQCAGFSNACSQIRNDSLSRFSNVTTATPAKRITFYKSGDTQFSGIRMPIHKRSFKCFDALLDDLSQKMPLPFGVRTITTPKGTRAIQSLEQLQDGACYLCSDRHSVKPIDMEAAGKRPAVWHHSYPLNTRRKPSRPDDPPTGHSGHHYLRQPKRIVLVKNNDPAVRRSIILSRKRARSLRVFMDEISELMQCNVRKLYTLEGRKIDSMQSLMQCPSVLVCVGREPFKALLLENLRKNSEEKLPGIGARSHSSIYTEGHDSKKNVNFGLETKKSIIHPRSDSSNKSTRFSLSSEKSYPNGSGMTPGQPGCVTKEVIMNDDVEKRVLINKDGSLSVEMKVRFRLVNDETLQWSTEIKKLPTSRNECISLQEDDPHCLQGTVVYSEPESNTECEAEDACSPKCHQMDVESYCQSCCNHSQGYDIWKNPLHKDDETSGTRSSSNSVASSDKIMHQKESVDSVYTISRSSEEYTEHVVEKASCFRQTTEEGDTRIEYCSISRCCSQSEVSTSTTKCNIPTDTCESNTGKICHHNDNRKTDYAEFDHLSKVTKIAENLISATRNSSIFQSFKKDEDDDYDDLSPSISRASQWCSEQDKKFTCVHCYGSQQSQNLHSSSIPPKASSCSADALKSKMYKSMYAAPEVPQEGHADTDSTDSARSSVSKVSSKSQCCCCCSQCREATTSLVESEMKSGLKERVQNSMSDESKMSNKSRASTNSSRMVISDSGAQKTCKEETKSGNRSISAMSTNTCFSVKSTVCPCCGGCGRLISTIPANVHDTPVQVAEEDGEVMSLGQRSSKSPESERSNKCTHCAPQRHSASSNILENIEPVQNNIAEVEIRHACSQSALFDLSNCSAASKQSNISIQPACGRSSIAKMISENDRVEEVEGRSKSAMSVKSVGSAKTNNDIPDKLRTFGLENQIAEEIGNLCMAQENITETEDVTHDSDMDTTERVPSAMSTKTHSSKDSDKSHNSNNIQDTATASPPVSTSPITYTTHEKIHSDRSTIALSKSAKVSVKSNACSQRDLESVLNPTDMSEGQETRQTRDDAKCSARNSLPVSPITLENNNQALSVKSVYSKASSKSTRSNKHHCSSSRCVQRVANSPLGKSKSPASHGLLDEPLSPTSTASVSLGLGEEERSEDLNERSMSNISQILDEPRCSSEKYTSEPSALDHAINNSSITETRERVKTAVSTSTTVSDKPKLSNFMKDSCNNPEVISGAEYESISTKSKTESKIEVQLLQNDGDHRVPSVLSESSEKSQQNSPSKNTSTIKRYTHDTQAINKITDKGETNKALTTSGSSISSQNKITSGKATAHGATSKDQCTAKSKERSSSNLEIKEGRKTDATSVISLKTSKSDKKPPPRDKYVTKSEVSQNCAISDSKGDSVLSHSPDLLREKDTDAKPDSRGSRSNTSDKNYVLEEMQQIDSDCKKNSFKQRKISTTSQNKTEDHDKEPLMPSCLPNASPTDVVNDWLKNIPIDGPMYEMEDEFSVQHDETLLHIPAVKDEGSFQNEIGEQSEKPMKMKESKDIGGTEGADPVTEDKNTICDAKLAFNKTFQTIAANSDCNHLSSKLTNNCQSSIQVMKVLLSPKLDRCNSLPEVSPTYGRKLSTSAKGLLDCLANLQVLDPDPKIYDKYSEIISTLQSLWINRPSETVQDKHKIKVHSAEDEFNPRSSSGVDLSSGSTGSGKGSISGGLEKPETAQPRTTLISEQKPYPQIQGDALMGGGCDSLSPENINTLLVSDPITPDIAERVRCSPNHEKLNKEAQKDEGLKGTDDVLQTNEHIKEIEEIASTFSTTNTENNGNVKSVANKETNPPENNNSRTPPSDQKGQLTKRISQDPDPVWVLSLLKKLEKQFMSHYANAVAEFKVRWDLNDNETLDIMISELKEEVHKRIQSTINRELQKIQSRAGRTPRPPIGMLSRDSTVQTEQRRRRLKVMQNKRNPSRSEDINTASGTEFSDQRSEDEYCPCDTCVKKKMASRAVQCAEALRVAPVLKDFDLRKILQTKKDPPVTMPVQSKLDEPKDQIEGTDSSSVQDKNNLEVVKEEAKVHIIKSQIVEDDILMEEETKDEIITEHGIQACENQDEDVGVINDGGWRTVNKGPSDEEDNGQPAEAKMFDNKVDGADDGESKTERERHEVGEDLEDRSTDMKDEEAMNREDEEAEEATEGATTADEEIEMEKDPPDEVAAERKETESSEIEEREGNPVEEKEWNDEGAEGEVSEGETNKESETGVAEEEERDEIVEKAEIPEEGEETENRTGEETQSAKEGKTGDESGEAENSNATSDERTQDDAPAAAAEAKPRKNETAEIIEGEKTEEDGTIKSEAKMSTENSADENQSESTEAENEVEKESHESKGKRYIQKPTKKKDNLSVAGQLVSEEEDGDRAYMDDCGTDEKHQTDMRAESIENHAEGPDHWSQISGDDSDCKLISQITKTSVESQTGSLEYSKELTVKEKLRDIQSFMESLNDQDS
ncbi:retinitis pigmentosa 1-like 1 protein [Pangasianodon hypophthalmus]|uniref:retinitis pigmentosa 1-like 1 protein n=1 Tax=Pangasianodon hypophthalmus TaxID=310915 RepID=UPI002308358B|nr:retinitis pigmentosa 1-like 1 protein [Pangasianodon hypophthalmus]